jgi:hypothetical protein
MRCGAPSHPSPTKRGVRSYSLRKKLKINFAEGYITPNVLIGWTRVTICVNRCMTFYHSALFALISHTDDVMCWLDSIYHQEIVCCEHVAMNTNQWRQRRGHATHCLSFSFFSPFTLNHFFAALQSHISHIDKSHESRDTCMHTETFTFRATRKV